LKSSALAIAGKVAAIPGVYRLRESESRLVCIGTAQKALQWMFSVLQIALATDKIVSEDGHNWSVGRKWFSEWWEKLERLDGRFSRRIARDDHVACLGVVRLLKVNPKDQKVLQPAATD
jgi:hypothetical protein